MAKLQFGNSSVRIEGLYVPVADMNLARGTAFTLRISVLLWKDRSVNITTMPLSALEASVRRNPLIRPSARSRAYRFSKGSWGELSSSAAPAWRFRRCSEHILYCGHQQRRVRLFQTNVGSRRKPTMRRKPTIHRDVHGWFFRSGTPGLLCCTRAAVYLYGRWLPPNHLVKSDGAVFRILSVQMHLHFEHPSAFIQQLGLLEQPVPLAALVADGASRHPVVFDGSRRSAQY